jgi:hypothetical protein
VSKRLSLAAASAEDPGAEALEALARALAPRVAELLKEQAQGEALVDVVATVPGPKRTVMRACRSGAISGSVCVGRRWLAPRSSVEHWLRSLGPRAVQTPADDDGDELEALRAQLARPGRRRVSRP